MARRDQWAAGSLAIVRCAVVAAGLFLAAIAAGIAASLLMGDGFTVMLLGPGGDLAERTSGMRLLLIVGVAMAVAALVLLRSIHDVVATVRSGDPFVAANAARLRRAAWALLVLQLLDVPCALIARGFPSLGAAAPDVGVSPGGWLAVLMTFVLARVFAVGTVMRDDLEGTV